jgi:hypothetical protein
MLHMPTHIDIAVGDYRRSIDASSVATAADDRYFSHERAAIFGTVYRVHHINAKLYAALISGRFNYAMSAAQKLKQVITPEILATTTPAMADWVEAFLGDEAHVLIRFGRWEDILGLEVSTDNSTYCATTANILYARCIAFCSLQRINEAKIERREFEEARQAVPRTRLNSLPCREWDVLEIA